MLHQSPPDYGACGAILGPRTLLERAGQVIRDHRGNLRHASAYRRARRRICAAESSVAAATSSTFSPASTTACTASSSWRRASDIGPPRLGQVRTQAAACCASPSMPRSAGPPSSSSEKPSGRPPLVRSLERGKRGTGFRRRQRSTAPRFRSATQRRQNFRGRPVEAIVMLAPQAAQVAAVTVTSRPLSGFRFGVSIS